MVKIAVLGYGTVGSGVVEIVNKNSDVLTRHTGEEIQVKYVLDLREFPGDPVQEILVHDFNIILEDPEVRLVVEVMGGTGAAYEFVKKSLLAGKSVCTSNKALVAKYGPELIRIAREKKINFFYEASVGGGIPIIRPLINSLTADRIDEISGILNGTTNYILTKMTYEGQDFDTVLKEAQALGYAEANPEADVEGYDACRKIAILSSMNCGKQVDFEDIYTEGITKITQADIAYGKAMGCAVKLLARSKVIDGQMYAMVAPFLIRKDHPLYNINGVFNAVFVHGPALGDVMFYGSGAGKLPTAAAVVADVVEAVRHFGCNVLIDWSEETYELGSADQFSCAYLVRVAEADEEKLGALGSGRKIDAGIDGEIGFITETMTEEEFARRAADVPYISRIRIA